MKPLLDPIAQKGYAYAFGDKLPDYFMRAAEKLVEVEEADRRRRDEAEKEKQRLEREAKVRKLQEAQFLSQYDIDLNAPLLEGDLPRLREKADRYQTMRGAVLGAGLTSDEGWNAHQESLRLRNDIMSDFQQSKKRREDFYTPYYQILERPDEYEQTPEMALAPIVEYNDFVMKGGDPSKYQYNFSPKNKVEPMDYKVLVDNIVGVLPVEAKTESKKREGQLYDTKAVKTWDETTKEFKFDDLPVAIERIAASDEGAAKTLRLMNLIDENGKVRKDASLTELQGAIKARQPKAETTNEFNMQGTKPRPQASYSNQYNPTSLYTGTSGKGIKQAVWNKNVFAGDVVQNFGQAEMIYPINIAPKAYPASEMPIKTSKGFNGNPVDYYVSGADGSVASGTATSFNTVESKARATIPLSKAYKPLEYQLEPLGYMNVYLDEKRAKPIYSKYEGETAQEWYENTRQRMGDGTYQGAVPMVRVKILYERDIQPLSAEDKRVAKQLPETVVREVLIPADMTEFSDQYNLKPQSAETARADYGVKGMPKVKPTSTPTDWLSK